MALRGVQALAGCANSWSPAHLGRLATTHPGYFALRGSAGWASAPEFVRLEVTAAWRSLGVATASLQVGPRLEQHVPGGTSLLSARSSSHVLVVCFPNKHNENKFLALTFVSRDVAAERKWCVDEASRVHMLGHKVEVIHRTRKDERPLEPRRRGAARAPCLCVAPRGIVGGSDS